MCVSTEALGAAAAPLMVVSLLGSALQSKATLDSADANVSAAEAEQKSYEQSAASKYQSASYEAQQKAIENRQARSKAAVEYASSGLNPNSGSGSDVQQDIVGSNALDTTAIMSNAAREAWGLREQGRQGVENAKNQRKAARYSAGGSLLTGAANAFSLFS